MTCYFRAEGYPTGWTSCPTRFAQYVLGTRNFMELQAHGMRNLRLKAPNADIAQFVVLSFDGRQGLTTGVSEQFD
jgi:hypothetical protein